MQFQGYGVSHTGRIRDHNEDAYLIDENLGLYLVFTYAWINPDIFYDLTVNPFIDQLQGVGDLYNPESYYMQNVFPVGQLQKAGAILAAGSDAPVDTREPRPFVNIQQAVTRSNEAGQVMNPAGIVNIRSSFNNTIILPEPRPTRGALWRAVRLRARRS